MKSVVQKLPRRLAALLLALSLLAPASSFGRMLYACRMSGQVSSQGCCCRKAKLREAQADRAAGLAHLAQVDRPDCCQAEDHRRAALTSLWVDAEPMLDAPALATRLPARDEAEMADRRVSFAARSIRGPPGDARRFVTNCSLLI